MGYPTFKLDGKTFAVVPREVLADLGVARETADQRRRRLLAARLRAAREHAGLSQAALAERLGLSQPFVSTAENGARKVGERYLATVLEACELPADWTAG